MTSTQETTAEADPRAEAFAAAYPVRPIPTEQPINTDPISCPLSAEAEAELAKYNPIWERIVPESRTRGNDIHLPISLRFAQRLCDAYPEADRDLVMISVILHDTGWAHVDESRILSEGFGDNWRKAAIRFEHEEQGCNVAQRVLGELDYSEEFIEKVCEIIDGHDTRPVAYSLEDALMRDSDRLWRFDHAGISLAASWFGQDPAWYTDRLTVEIIPELLTQAGYEMGTTDLARSKELLQTGILR
ncbi:hydrolase [Arthrobacter sp. HMSC06H05]|uniref:HD domain-containing protein n=1 Tax=Arthrobacter sp. HMSC06H05 TaxID=1581128 RepID=UPI0008A59E3D|nr:HD domain-containing protein [Arthrobacter sp. HMSC06H05]OFT43815.1 hydrolase [Arthrobacter sp. HMSC06H05]